MTMPRVSGLPVLKIMREAEGWVSTTMPRARLPANRHRRGGRRDRKRRHGEHVQH
ncbi:MULTISPECIES: hypothetical protein [Mesorhizobium]|uniref:hypothetical protein n=1 Tax=Mesorhizobium TaxID=68287 RepID=UPI00142E042D|nr:MULTISPECIES: hypothetical protein [Mesorhizobium]